MEFRLAYRNIQDPLYFDKNANKVVFIPVVDEGVGFVLLFQEMTEEKKAIIEFFPESDRGVFNKEDAVVRDPLEVAVENARRKQKGRKEGAENDADEDLRDVSDGEEGEEE